MQLVGAQCSVCRQSIKLALDAGECPSCEIAFHTACLTQPKLCPSCGKNYVDALRARESKKSAAHADDLAQGRKIVLSCGIALLTLEVFAMVGAYRIEGSYGFALAAIRFAFVFSAFVALYYGYLWAKRWFQLSTTLAVLGSVQPVLLAIRNDKFLLVGLTGALLAVYGLAFGYITFSRKVAKYMEAWALVARGQR